MDCGSWERTVIIALFLREYGQILVFEVDVFQVEPLATLIIAVPKYLGSAHARIGEKIDGELGLVWQLLVVQGIVRLQLCSEA